MKAAITPLAPLLEHERLDLFAVYLSMPRLHHIDFEDVIADAALRICLRNVLEARRREQAKKRRASVQSSTEFQLT